MVLLHMCTRSGYYTSTVCVVTQRGRTYFLGSNKELSHEVMGLKLQSMFV